MFLINMKEEKGLLCTRRSKFFVTVGSFRYSLKTLTDLNEQYPIGDNASIAEYSSLKCGE